MLPSLSKWSALSHTVYCLLLQSNVGLYVIFSRETSPYESKLWNHLVRCSNMALLLKELKDVFSSLMPLQARQHCGAGNMLPSSYWFSMSVVNDGCEPVPAGPRLAGTGSHPFTSLTCGAVTFPPNLPSCISKSHAYSKVSSSRVRPSSLNMAWPRIWKDVKIRAHNISHCWGHAKDHSWKRQFPSALDSLMPPSHRPQLP